MRKLIFGIAVMMLLVVSGQVTSDIFGLIDEDVSQYTMDEMVAIEDGFISVGSLKGSLRDKYIARHDGEGKLVWFKEVFDDDPEKGRGFAGLLVVDGLVYVSGHTYYGDNFIYLYTMDGEFIEKHAYERPDNSAGFNIYKYDEKLVGVSGDNTYIIDLDGNIVNTLTIGVVRDFFVTEEGEAYSLVSWEGRDFLQYHDEDLDVLSRSLVGNYEDEYPSISNLSIGGVNHYLEEWEDEIYVVANCYFEVNGSSESDLIVYRFKKTSLEDIGYRIYGGQGRDQHCDSLVYEDELLVMVETEDSSLTYKEGRGTGLTCYRIDLESGELVGNYPLENMMLYLYDDVNAMIGLENGFLIKDRSNFLEYFVMGDGDYDRQFFVTYDEVINQSVMGIEYPEPANNQENAVYRWAIGESSTESMVSLLGQDYVDVFRSDRNYFPGENSSENLSSIRLGHKAIINAFGGSDEVFDLLDFPVHVWPAFNEGDGIFWFQKEVMDLEGIGSVIYHLDGNLWHIIMTMEELEEIVEGGDVGIRVTGLKEDEPHSLSHVGRIKVEFFNEDGPIDKIEGKMNFIDLTGAVYSGFEGYDTSLAGVLKDDVISGLDVEDMGLYFAIPIFESGTYQLKMDIMSPTFNDIDFLDANHVYPIEQLAKKGVISGRGDMRFDPEGLLTRGELAKILTLGLELELQEGDSGFSDVKSSDWYSPYVNAVKEAGIINGYPDGTYRPNQPVTRNEIAKIIGSWLYEKGIGFPSASDGEAALAEAFDDAHNIVSWVRPYAKMLADEGFMYRIEEVKDYTYYYNFAGEDYVNRADAVKLIYDGWFRWELEE